MNPIRRRLPGRGQLTSVVLTLLLGAWAAGIGIAAWRLHGWQREISQVLVQLRADDLLRASVAATHERIDPQWYRRRALALMNAVERMREDSAWTLVIPGSWRSVDDLEERAMARIADAFGLVVVETLDRELDRRASALTGLPLTPAGHLATQSRCVPPPLHGPAQAATSTGAASTPEHAALRSFLEQVRDLDRAVTGLSALQRSGQAAPDDLRHLVRYALGEELSGPASRSLSLFHASAPAGDASGLRSSAAGAWAWTHCTAVCWRPTTC
jgi:type VI secretion system protein ImpL